MLTGTVSSSHDGEDTTQLNLAGVLLCGIPDEPRPAPCPGKLRTQNRKAEAAGHDAALAAQIEDQRHFPRIDPIIGPGALQGRKQVQELYGFTVESQAHLPVFSRRTKGKKPPRPGRSGSRGSVFRRGWSEGAPVVRRERAAPSGDTVRS